MFEKLSSRDRSVMDAVIRSANDSLERGRTIAMSHIAKCESHIDELEQRVSNLTKERVEALKSMHQAVSDRGELVNQITKLTKERDEARDAVRVEMTSEREPRDNGDGTVTQLLPVTYDAKWRGRVEAVRSPRYWEKYAGCYGNECVAESGEEFDSHDVVLILSPPAPSPQPEPIPSDVYYSREHQNFYCSSSRHGMGDAFWAKWKDRRSEFPLSPPEPVTWRANLPDGTWTACAKVFVGNDARNWYWNSAGSSFGIDKPAKLGRYLFTGGIGTWQGDA